jgi:hypothetical protein
MKCQFLDWRRFKYPMDASLSVQTEIPCQFHEDRRPIGCGPHFNQKQDYPSNCHPQQKGKCRSVARIRFLVSVAQFPYLRDCLDWYPAGPACLTFILSRILHIRSSASYRIIGAPRATLENISSFVCPIARRPQAAMILGGSLGRSKVCGVIRHKTSQPPTCGPAIVSVSPRIRGHLPRGPGGSTRVGRS